MTNDDLTPDIDVVVEYPFRIHKVFFAEINVKRSPAVIESPIINILVETKLSKREEPNNFQLNFKLRSNREDDCPVALDLEIVSIFEAISGNAFDPTLLVGFINHRLLFIAASMASNLLSQLTSQMGMSPIQLPLPLAFGFHRGLIPDSLWDSPKENLEAE